VIRKRLILNRTFRCHEKNDILWVGEIFADDKVYRTKSGNIQYSLQLWNERFSNFHLDGKVLWHFRSSRALVGCRKKVVSPLWLCCDILRNKQKFLLRLLATKFTPTTTSDVFYIGKVLHKSADGNFSWMKAMKIFMHFWVAE
jgi:hypothetical protein